MIQPSGLHANLCSHSEKTWKTWKLEAAGTSRSVLGLAWAQEKVFKQLCLFLSGCDKAKALGWTQSSAKLEFER